MISSTRRWLIGSLCAGLPLLGAAGCKETVSSKNIRTQGISMAAVVTAGSSSSTVEVTLKVGGDESNTYVNLEGGDRLIALADDEEKEMDRKSAGVYEVRFNTNAADTAFEVHLERDGDDDARRNRGTLPPPFRITSDLGDDPISRADTFELTWEPSGGDDPMKLEIDDAAGESCIFAERFDQGDGLTDTGSFTVRGLDGTGSDDETCEIVIDLIRERRGSLDRVLDPESTFVLRQVRSTIATSSP